MRELPVLQPLRCTRCGDCVAACPVDCLEMDHQRPWLRRPADCVSCSACVLICPTDALSMKPLPPA